MEQSTYSSQRECGGGGGVHEESCLLSAAAKPLANEGAMAVCTVLDTHGGPTDPIAPGLYTCTLIRKDPCAISSRTIFWKRPSLTFTPALPSTPPRYDIAARHPSHHTRQHNIQHMVSHNHRPYARVLVRTAHWTPRVWSGVVPHSANRRAKASAAFIARATMRYEPFGCIKKADAWNELRRTLVALRSPPVPLRPHCPTRTPTSSSVANMMHWNKSRALYAY